MAEEYSTTRDAWQGRKTADAKTMPATRPEQDNIHQDGKVAKFIPATCQSRSVGILFCHKEIALKVRVAMPTVGVGENP